MGLARRIPQPGDRGMRGNVRPGELDPPGERQGQETVASSRLAAWSSAKRASCQGVC
jgi:hypothetical protein